MKIKFNNIFLLIICLLLLPIFLWSFSIDKCLKCHKKDNILKGNIVHKPVKKGCNNCHQSHVSRYDKLLMSPLEELCLNCHKKTISKLSKMTVIHTPVEKGACIRCHSPHSSKNKFLLKNISRKLCLECHKKIKINFKFTHQPFKQGKCLKCHTAHGSNDRRFLRKQDSKICLNCHKITKNLKNTHKNMLTNNDCLSCHNPHGSSNKKLLRKFTHIPYKKRQCNYCHKHKNMTTQLCFSCHQDIKESFNKLHNHLLGGFFKNSCLACHSPHLGENKKLLIDSPKRLCQKCHPETYIQKKNSLYIHPKWNNCSECHVSHGSNHPAMIKGDGNQVCVNCHKTQGKFTHPVGERIKDPRNGQEMTCVTCHDPMGTNFKNNLRLSGEGALCLECHKNY